MNERKETLYALISGRFDLAKTRHLFLLAFTIPAVFWVFSCSFLASSNKVGNFMKDIFFNFL